MRQQTRDDETTRLHRDHDPELLLRDETRSRGGARRHWTRHWRANAAPAFELVTSSAVIDELSRGAFPARGQALGDALHLALASFNRCDFLLTWNCEHLVTDASTTRRSRSGWSRPGRRNRPPRISQAAIAKPDTHLIQLRRSTGRWPPRRHRHGDPGRKERPGRDGGCRRGPGPGDVRSRPRETGNAARTRVGALRATRDRPDSGHGRHRQPRWR